jgi:hypothetical protein
MKAQTQNEDTLVEDLTDGIPNQSIVDQDNVSQMIPIHEAPTAPYAKLERPITEEEVTQEIPVESFSETAARCIADRREQEMRMTLSLIPSCMRPTVNMRPLKKP